MSGNELGPTEIPFDRIRLLRTCFILETEVGALSIHVKMLISRDGPLDIEDKAHIHSSKTEIADTIFQSVKLAGEMGLKDSLYDLYRLGKEKYMEKMKEYRDKDREWI